MNKNDKKDAENVEVIAKNNSKVQDFLNGNGDDIVIGETEADNSEYNENAYNDIPEENHENPVLVDDSGRVDDLKTNDKTAVPLKPCDLCAVATQHPCRKCGIPVCNLACSIQDPTSENELHRAHKPGDSRCVRSTHKNASMLFS